MKIRNYRILATILAIAAIISLPWQISASILVAMALIFPLFFEGLIIAILADTAFAANVPGLFFVFSTIVCAALLLKLALKTELYGNLSR